MKLWAGRFQKETEPWSRLNSSISFDARMYGRTSPGPIAHAAMLGRQGIIKEHEAEKIIDGLKAILADIEARTGGVLPGERGYPHEYRDHPHPTHRGHGQAAAHRPQPE